MINDMKIIALLGNPNSGKTSVFNLLTGSNQQVGNWPGVTVEKKSGLYKKDKTICIQDLPGLYSLSAYSTEEKVTRNFLRQTPPDALINIVDSTNLERSLYLTLQLMELGIPMVLALNMSDLIEKEGKKIDIEKLAYRLDIPVVSISALKRKGLEQVIKETLKAKTGHPPDYDQQLEAALSEIKKICPHVTRFEQIKSFEGDSLALAELSDQQKREIDEIANITEKVMGEERESLIVNERYDFIEQVVRLSVSDNSSGKAHLTDKIDQIVTNKWLGLPIFILIMWLVYFLSIQTVGTAASDWLNDTFFGQYLPDFVSNLMNRFDIIPWVQDLVRDGVLSGVGAILGFVPQIFVLFFLLGFLEDSGYMARVAFVMDRIFRRFGLSGKSFIPLLIASGCGVPGVMATRTIEQERDRKITIMVTTFIPCSAKIPIIALISGAFFKNASWVAPSAYFLGMGMIILSAIILKKTRMFSGDTAAFIMELPSYRLPHLNTVLRYAFSRAMSFVKRAGTVIFALNVIIWFASNYSWTLQQVDPSASILASIGKSIALFFAPLGFGEWRAAVATLTGLVAKETVVGTMGVLYAPRSGSLETVLQQAYTPLAAYSLLVFNLLCAPCIAAISTIHKEMGEFKWTLRAIGFQTLVAYTMSFIIYQFGLVFTGKNYDLLTFIASLALILGAYFVFRKGKTDKQELQTI